ncbi:unnamed protein product, partial [Closterium sp. Yama58-4]
KSLSLMLHCLTAPPSPPSTRPPHLVLLQTNFQGRVFMTHATKAVYRLLLSDFVRVSKVAVDDALFTEQDIQQSMEKIEVIDFHQIHEANGIKFWCNTAGHVLGAAMFQPTRFGTCLEQPCATCSVSPSFPLSPLPFHQVIDFHQIHEVNGIKFWCYTAGHVLGAAMFAVDIAGIRVLYTGDYSREEDRHLRAAEVPPFSPDLCVIESTFGVQIHEPREVRERRFLDFVVGTVLNGGRVLIPAFALGRAQELLLILDEHWRGHPEVQHVPLLYASPLARKTMVVYRTYLSAMNDRIREQAEVSNPFDFRFIKSLRSIAEFEDTGPAVVMASPGGLQSGLSRQLFDMWCQDARNTCLIPGYVVEGTLAKTILSEPNEVTLQSGATVPLRMKVHYVSFAAHADYPQTSHFLEQIRPPHIVLVHGEAHEMARLKAKLALHFKDSPAPPSIHTPKNCQGVEFFFKGEKIAKVVGRIAEKGGVMAPGPFEPVIRRLEMLFDSVVLIKDAGVPAVQVHEKVIVAREGEDRVVLQWASEPVGDMLADSIVALILQLESGRQTGKDLTLLTSAGGRGGRGVKVEGGGREGGEKVVKGEELDEKTGALVAGESDKKGKEKGKEGGGGKEESQEVGKEEDKSKALAKGEEGQGDGVGEGEGEGEEGGKWRWLREDEMKHLERVLESMFGGVKRDGEERLRVSVDGVEVSVRVGEGGGEVECAEEGLKKRVREAVNRFLAAVRPIPPPVGSAVGLKKA